MYLTDLFSSRELSYANNKKLTTQQMNHIFTGNTNAACEGFRKAIAAWEESKSNSKRKLTAKEKAPETEPLNGFGRAILCRKEQRLSFSPSPA